MRRTPRYRRILLLGRVWRYHLVQRNHCLVMSEERTYNYYRCGIDTAMGRKLARLTERYINCTHAAEAMAIKVGAKEFVADDRHMAGGIGWFIFDREPRAKKLLVSARKEGNEHWCVPNPHTNRGLKLACRLARLPHVSVDEYCEVFGIDRNDPAYKEGNHSLPMFFTVEDKWAYVRSTIALASTDLTTCEESDFDEALKYVNGE